MITARTSFHQKLMSFDRDLLVTESVSTVQINVGDLCNQYCEHCHVNAGPQGKNNMTWEVFAEILACAKKGLIKTLDITGGAPEMNPFFRRFVALARPYVESIMVRSNLTIFEEEGMGDLPHWYQEHNIHLIASLPCYTEETVDKQRGRHVFEKSIRALQSLNQKGYGDELFLDLVYNPSGPFLPPDQDVLEQQYKQELQERYNIRFNRLFVITNIPIGRYRTFLEKKGELAGYLHLLEDHFNPQAAPQIMCRHLVSIDWQGNVYNCDFNQQERLPARKRGKKTVGR